MIFFGVVLLYFILIYIFLVNFSSLVTNFIERVFSYTFSYLIIWGTSDKIIFSILTSNTSIHSLDLQKATFYISALPSFKKPLVVPCVLCSVSYIIFKNHTSSDNPCYWSRVVFVTSLCFFHNLFYPFLGTFLCFVHDVFVAHW